METSGIDFEELARFYKGRRILVTGGNGFVGRWLCGHLRQHLGARVQSPPSSELDLCKQHALRDFMLKYGGAHLIFHLAGVTGGIGSVRSFPYSYLAPNAQMALEIGDFAAHQMDIPIVAAGSVCAYPQYVPVPMIEENLWNGRPEETNFAYGESKRLLSTILEAAHKQYGTRYAYLLLANMYGPGDHFDDPRAHVVPSLISRIYAAKQKEEPQVVIWGSGQPTRDFLFVTDAVRAFVNAGYVISQPGMQPVVCNIGSGEETRINHLAYIIASQLGYAGNVVYDPTKPDGQPRRRLDVHRAERLIHWSPQVDIVTGIEQAIASYLRKKEKEQQLVAR